MINTACKEEQSGWKGTEENVIKPTPLDVDSLFYSAIFDIIYKYGDCATIGKLSIIRKSYICYIDTHIKGNCTTGLIA